MPLVGTRRTFLIFGLACALVAVTGIARRAALAVPAVIVALLALPVGTIKAAGDGTVLDEVETEYQYARVVEEPDGDRKLELNEGQAVHSLYRPGSYLTGDYWDEFLVLPFAARSSPPRAVAILGNAAGTTARALGRYFPTTSVDAVEIDSELTEARAALVRPAQSPDARAPRGRAAVPAPDLVDATTRSWSTCTASPTSRSTWRRGSSSSWCATT